MRRLTCRLSTAVSEQAHCYGFISFSLQTECKSVFECNEMEGIEKPRKSRLFSRSQIVFVVVQTATRKNGRCVPVIPYTTAFPYGNGMVLHFYQQQEHSTTKTVHKVINKGLKTYV